MYVAFLSKFPSPPVSIGHINDILAFFYDSGRLKSNPLQNVDDTTSYVYVKRVDSQACVEFRGLHSTPSSISSVFLVPWCHACSWCFDSIAFLCICVVQCGSVKNVSRNWSRFLLFWLNFICVVRINRYETKSTGNTLPKFFYSKSKFINSVIYLKTKPTLSTLTGRKFRCLGVRVCYRVSKFCAARSAKSSDWFRPFLHHVIV